MNSVQFLDAVRERHAIPSDRKLARFLGVENARVSSYRTGRRKLDPDACVAVAKALELPPEHVFAAVAAERAKRTEHRRIWERLAKLAKHAGAAVVLAYAATWAPPAPAATTSADAQSLYILLSRVRRWISSAWRPFRAPIVERRHRRPRRPRRLEETAKRA